MLFTAPFILVLPPSLLINSVRSPDVSECNACCIFTSLDGAGTVSNEPPASCPVWHGWQSQGVKGEVGLEGSSFAGAWLGRGTGLELEETACRLRLRSISHGMNLAVLTQCCSSLLLFSHFQGRVRSTAILL